ncbi:bromo-adjacent-like (BAH) domain protein [Trifolium pratense]|uniref:Bromo-adjacent-like (BAH) domain protein n=1 Tax=Trifolium pratense TaxID=57577 RepID=A0A2K3NL02_TRIPR|nr:bromo-adjacent-like (BAH) domain protein [Trifolium pratense]
MLATTMTNTEESAPAPSEESETLKFKWGKMRGKGGKKKDTQFYESFTLDGVDYELFDTVYVQNGFAEPSIGKIIKIWETPTVEKLRKIKVQWFFRPCQISRFLNGVKIYYNELFFACGDGPEVASINSLESIAGKCNVVCISKDPRNPRLSDETVWRAEFVFHRYFDVGKHKILEELRTYLTKWHSQKLAAAAAAVKHYLYKELVGALRSSSELAFLSNKNTQSLDGSWQIC